MQRGIRPGRFVPLKYDDKNEEGTSPKKRKRNRPKAPSKEKTAPGEKAFRPGQKRKNHSWTSLNSLKAKLTPENELAYHFLVGKKVPLCIHR